MRTRLILIRDRVRALGYRGDDAKHLSWAVGATIRNQWEANTGTRPQMELVRKTSGAGTHQMAVYPEHWTERIDAAIHKEAAAHRARATHTGQTSLF